MCSAPSISHEDWFKGFEKELREMLKNPKWTNNGDLAIKEILGE